MSKSSSAAEQSPESQPRPRAVKPRRRKVAAASMEPAPTTAIVQAASPVKPLLIGLGVGAAIGAAALVLGSQTRGGRTRAPSQPSFGGILMKAALLALARSAAQRAVRIAADKAALTVADAWNPVKLR